MKKLMNAGLLAALLVASSPFVFAQGAGQSPTQQKAAQRVEAKDGKAKAKEGADCNPQRANVRCSRPKPRKPWFFGK